MKRPDLTERILDRMIATYPTRFKQDHGKSLKHLHRDLEQQARRQTHPFALWQLRFALTLDWIASTIREWIDVILNDAKQPRQHATALIATGLALVSILSVTAFMAQPVDTAAPFRLFTFSNQLFGFAFVGILYMLARQNKPRNPRLHIVARIGTLLSAAAFPIFLFGMTVQWLYLLTKYEHLLTLNLVCDPYGLANQLGMFGLAIAAISSGQFKRTLQTILPLLAVMLLAGIGQESVSFTTTHIGPNDNTTNMIVTLFGLPLPSLIGLAWLWLPKLMLLLVAARTIDETASQTTQHHRVLA